MPDPPIQESGPHGTQRSALDQQIGGSHYKKLGAYQPWKVLAHWMTPAELRGFAKGSSYAPNLFGIMQP